MHRQCIRYIQGYRIGGFQTSDSIFCRHRLWTLWFGGEKNWIGDCKKSPAWCMLMVHKKLWLPAIPQVRFIVTRMKFGELYLLVFQVFWKATAPKKSWLLETVLFVEGFPGNSLVSTDSRSGSASHNHFRFKLKKAVWAEKSWKMIYNVFWNRQSSKWGLWNWYIYLKNPLINFRPTITK